MILKELFLSTSQNIQYEVEIAEVSNMSFDEELGVAGAVWMSQKAPGIDNIPADVAVILHQVELE